MERCRAYRSCAIFSVPRIGVAVTSEYRHRRASPCSLFVAHAEQLCCRRQQAEVGSSHHFVAAVYAYRSEYRSYPQRLPPKLRLLFGCESETASQCVPAGWREETIKVVIVLLRQQHVVHQYRHRGTWFSPRERGAHRHFCRSRRHHTPACHVAVGTYRSIRR